MKRDVVFMALIVILSVFLGMASSGSDYDKYWPQWRGPDATGVAPYGNPPTEWSEEKNIRWKIEIPGKGHASPVIWKDKVYILTAIEGKEVVKQGTQDGNDGQGQQRGRRRRRRGIQPTHELAFTVMAIKREDGNMAWQQSPRTLLPHEGTHSTATWASNSAITDGEHLFAYFGSYGLYAYDMDGNLKWETDLGNMRTRNSFGEGSSPALHGDKLVINWDHEDDSFIAVFDKNSGKELWRKSRDEPTSWTTPLVVEHGGQTQVIVSATNRVRSYDLDSGDVIWECGGMTVNAIPTPVYADGVVYVTSGYRGSALLAIRLADAKGDITNSEAVVWTYDKDTPYVPSPLLYKDNIYFLKVSTEILSRFNAKTGEPIYRQQRLEGIQGVYASPVGASDRVYFAGRNGTSVVISNKPDFEVLAVNTLDDGFDASPAIVDNELYLRGRQYLYCIASD
ncbi:PQQ-like beta-propeller repeat protein [bacterium]|nr:PQQ-like beta-propeller repeat protein [bacterium]